METLKLHTILHSTIPYHEGIKNNLNYFNNGHSKNYLIRLWVGEVSRGIITEEEYKKIENSNFLNNIWVKGLYKYLDEKWERIHLLEDYGITQGDITITVNDDTVLDLSTSVLESMDFVDSEEYDYPVTNDVVMTTVQKHSGIISDIMFVTSEEFDLSKLKFVRKDIHNEHNEVIIDSLISEIRYDGLPIPFGGSETDLRMSNVYFDKKEL